MDIGRALNILKVIGAEVKHRDSVCRKDGPLQYKRNFYVSNMMNFAQIKEQRAKVGATFNEFLLASIMHAVNE